jgi:hypothetical protein
VPTASSPPQRVLIIAVTRFWKRGKERPRHESESREARS